MDAAELDAVLDRRRQGAAGWSRLGRPVELEWIRADELVRDPDYQRAIRPERVEAIRAKFHEDGLGVLIVSLRDDGRRYIIDGQHRHQSVLRLGLGHKTLPCIVLSGLDKSDERRIFLLLNKERLPLSHREAFEARAAQGENLASDLSDLVAAHGLRVVAGKANPGPREIGSMSVLEGIDRRHGEGMVDRVLSVLEAGWSEQPGAYRACYLLAAAAVLAREGSDDARLALALAGCPPPELDRMVMARVDRPSYRGHGQYAAAMRELHDRTAS